MTDTEIIIEVAKLDGWTVCGTTTTQQDGSMYLSPEKAHAVDSANLPNYLTSRDAIIPVIEKWRNSLPAINTVTNIWKVLMEEVSHEYFYPIDILFCTPRQLCIVLLKATGKWKE